MLDHTAYPHIIDQILSYLEADADTLMAIARTGDALRQQVYAQHLRMRFIRHAKQQHYSIPLFFAHDGNGEEMLLDARQIKSNAAAISLLDVQYNGAPQPGAQELFTRAFMGKLEVGGDRALGERVSAAD